MISWLREPSDPRVRELNVALEKAREDAQYWHDLARIATEETDKIKDRYESLQKTSDSFRAVAQKVKYISVCSRHSESHRICRVPVQIKQLLILFSGQKMQKLSCRYMRIVWSEQRLSY